MYPYHLSSLQCSNFIGFSPSSMQSCAKEGDLIPRANPCSLPQEQAKSHHMDSIIISPVVYKTLRMNVNCGRSWKEYMTQDSKKKCSSTLTAPDPLNHLPPFTYLHESLSHKLFSQPYNRTRDTKQVELLTVFLKSILSCLAPSSFISNQSFSQ